jgi:hypothetical protein
VGDELRVVIEGEKDIGRPGGDRQRRHQAADQRSGTFRRRRCRQQEGGGDDHFDDEGEGEIKIGRHRRGTLYISLALASPGRAKGGEARLQRYPRSA